MWPVVGDVNFAYLFEVTSIKTLHCKVTAFLFVVNIFLRGIL